VINSETAAKLFEDSTIENLPDDAHKNYIDNISEKRTVSRKQKFEELNLENFGIEGLVEMFGKCINCHGCRSVCPICYCDLCTFESRDLELTPLGVESELRIRGGLRVPPGTILFHIGRMTHMAVSCVGCGMCSDVCPADIPVSMIFTKAGEKIQDTFGYKPGKSFDEKVPLTTFELNELTEVES
jgi:formate dehydrogenase subunit beta